MAKAKKVQRRDGRKSKLLRRALRYVQVPGAGGFESLEAGVEAGSLDRANIDAVAGQIEQAAYDPLVFGFKADSEESGPAPRAKLVNDARKALAALASGDARKKSALTTGQVSALEAIVRLSGRPAILTLNNRPREIPKMWEPRMYPILDDMAKTARAVGRIEVEGAGGYLGTGFLVAPRTIMTNNHVARKFCRQVGAKWQLRAGEKPFIDFWQEFGSAKTATFAITDVLGMHPTLDLALLQVKERGTDGARLAPPLKITDDESRASDGSQVYVVGYPAADYRNDAKAQKRIFNGIYEKKRIAPGRVMKSSVKKQVLTHDCTTLGGNSGSCVVEFDTGRVIGLHFSGNYLKENIAVLLPSLREDGFLATMHVSFVQERRGT